MPHSFSPVHWPNFAHAFAIVYCKIIGQLPTEAMLTNILWIGKHLLVRPLTATNSWSAGKAFFFRDPQGGDQPLLIRCLLLFQSCVTTAVSEILAPSCLIARVPAPTSQREITAKR
jgi:hypothetical protein